ncbi:MAG: iron-sulfur cluster assembly protein [Bacteroidota bacterium]
MSAHTLIDNPAGHTQMEADALDALRSVYDPEIPVNIYDLGLIYVLSITEDKAIEVRMTLTAPNCPAADIIPNQVEGALALVPEVTHVKVDLTFDPPFTPDMMSDEARLELGLF